MVRRGFSLIEVLIAVLVLAVGLLGLGAVFPAVISQQRAATDSIEATRAIKFALVQLFESGLVDFDDIIADGSIPVTLTGNNRDAYRWGKSGSTQFTRFDEKTGLLRLPTDQAQGGVKSMVRSQREVPVRARMFPETFSGTAPRYVWDAVTHRSRVTENIEVALFIRRINGAIRVPDGWQLSNLLAGLSPNGDTIAQVLPIAMDKKRDLLVRPSGGTDEIYAVPQVASIRVTRPQNRNVPVSDRMTVTGSDKIADRYLRIDGQKFVDDFGVIRTVKKFDRDTKELVVSPPFRGAEIEADSLVFTPDIPIRIRVIAVEGGS